MNLMQAALLTIRARLAVERARRVTVLDAVPVGGGTQLVVVAFGARELLLAVSKGQVQVVADQPA